VDRELTRAELDELLPLYALDALDGEEREQVRRYVERDTAAAAEAQSLREAAAVLARPDPAAPPSLWKSIERSMGATPLPRREPLLRPSPVTQRASRHRSGPRIAISVVAAAAVAAIAVLGVEVTRQQNRIDDLAAQMHHTTLTDQAQAARTTPGAHVIQLTSTDRPQSAEIVMLPDGTGYLMNARLPSLASSQTYQLWADISGTSAPKMVSLGIVGPHPGVVSFTLAEPAKRFEVTREPSPGSTTPSNHTMLAGLANS
jgi:anti-sigma-K factor RskA